MKNFTSLLLYLMRNMFDREADVVVGTPGRIIELLMKDYFSVYGKADQMLYVGLQRMLKSRKYYVEISDNNVFSHNVKLDTTY